MIYFLAYLVLILIIIATIGFSSLIQNEFNIWF